MAIAAMTHPSPQRYALESSIPAPPPPAPRPILGSVGGWNTNFALVWGGGYGGIPALVLCVLMVTMGPPWHDTTLDERGVSAQASPYAVEDTYVSHNDESLMRVRLRFADRSGRKHDIGLTTIDGRILARANRREPIDIDYDPQDPELVRFHGQKRSQLSGDAAFVPPMLLFVFILPGLPTFAWGLFQLRRRRSVYRNGVAALATIVEHTRSVSSENEEQLTNARYEFASPRGLHSGTIKSLTPPPVGARIWVLHAPDRPSLNLPA
jgi:hypothetical protein